MAEAWAWHLAGGSWHVVIRSQLHFQRTEKPSQIWHRGSYWQGELGLGSLGSLGDNPKLWQCCLGRLHMQTPQLSFPSGFIQPSLSLEEGNSQEPQGTQRVSL